MEQRRKILRVIARLNIGGPARHAVILNRGLNAEGYRTLLAHGRPAPEEGDLEELVFRNGLEAVRVPGLGRRIHATSDVIAFWTLLKLLFRERPDIVHTHTAKAGALGRCAGFVFNLTRTSRRARCAIVHTFHGHVLHGYFGPLGTRMVQLTERILARITDKIIAISERQRDEIAAILRLPDHKITVVPLGLDLEHLLAIETPDRSLRSSLGWSEDHLVVGYVGRLVPIKDVPMLLAAFAELARDNPAARLLIVGDGEQREKLEEAARAQRVTPLVHFAGWQHDLPRVYGAMDVVALTSRNEGTPVAIIEAMAAARPVVATSVGGVPDVVRQGESGLLVAPEDSVAFAAALARLAEDPLLRRHMGQQGREQVSRRFGSARLVSEVAALYEGLLRDREATR